MADFNLIRRMASEQHDAVTINQPQTHSAPRKKKSKAKAQAQGGGGGGGGRAKPRRSSYSYGEETVRQVYLELFDRPFTFRRECLYVKIDAPVVQIGTRRTQTVKLYKC